MAVGDEWERVQYEKHHEGQKTQVNSPYNTGRVPGIELARPIRVLRVGFGIDPPLRDSPARSPTAPMSSLQAEPTPNPNSLKFTTDAGPFLDGGMAAYISGVEDVFVTPPFVTVSKAPGTDWAAVKPDVEAVLSDHLQSR